MICYPSIKNTTPLLVVGPQRSGTRFITNVLNSIPGVIIQDEIPDPIIRKVFATLDKCNQNFGARNRKQKPLNWEQTKHDFMFSVWANLTKGKRKNFDSKCIFYGYKTPFHEIYFDTYNDFFEPVRPKYICCVRNFMDHYFSVHARWPHRNIINVAKRYTHSLRHLRNIKEKRPGDVLFFFLDDFKKEGVDLLYKKILSPLGLENVSHALEKASQGPANASAQLGLKKKKTLSFSQSLSLKIYPYPLREFQSLRSDFA
jgi:hypothetical protein